MRKNYWVTVKFGDCYGQKIHIKLALYAKEKELATEVRVKVERLIEQNPVFKNCFYEGYDAKEISNETVE